MIDEDRLKHSYSVAKKMVETGKKLGLKTEELQDLFVIGFNHDIGYEYTENGKGHNVVGGKILEKSGIKNWKEVYYHGRLTNEYSSLYLDILNYADMQVDKYGNDVGFEKRLVDIRGRYGEESDEYQECVKMIAYLKSRFAKLEHKDKDDNER